MRKKGIIKETRDPCIALWQKPFTHCVRCFCENGLEWFALQFFYYNDLFRDFRVMGIAVCTEL